MAAISSGDESLPFSGYNPRTPLSYARQSTGVRMYRAMQTGRGNGGERPHFPYICM